MSGSNDIRSIGHEADKDIVKLLNDMLDYAKKGEIIGLALAANMRGEYIVSHKGELSTSTIGQIEILKHDIIRERFAD